MGPRGFDPEMFGWWRAHRGEWRDQPGRGPWAGGPPPWVAGLLGMDLGSGRRGPKVRRGDVRSAIIDVLAAAAQRNEPINGYQVIQQITERSQGAWRPSPGSVYPTIQQLEDEGLVESDEEHGRRAIRLTDEGQAYAAGHRDELDAVWRPFDRDEEEGTAEFGGLRAEIAQVMGAMWQIVTTGSDGQRKAAAELLAETRRKLFEILAEGPTHES